MQNTTEQDHILDLARSTKDNIMIRALAGTGKSTMLEMIEQSINVKPILYICFGKLDLEKAKKQVRSTTMAKNFNGLGQSIWQHYINRTCKPDTNKIRDIYKDMINNAKKADQSRMWDIYWQVQDGVRKAKVLGYVPPSHTLAERSLVDWEDVVEAMEETPDDYCKSKINACLCTSIKTAYQGLIDFNDQVYMPAIFGGTFPTFPLVLGDECQDWNNVNWRMYQKLTKNARSIIVGDPNQSIYVFRGATVGGMEEAKRRYSAIEATLSVSFRCPRKIVESVRWHVPEFNWHKDGGSVTRTDAIDVSELNGDATFICRNNAPLFSLAMRLLAHGFSVSVAGSEIGPKVIGQMKHLGDGNLTRTQVLDKIQAWQDKREEAGSKSAADTAECMRVFARHGDNLDQAVAYAMYLFKQDGLVTFTTGHKSKGREWSRVFVLHDHLLGNDEQERNLAYVMATRSADQLYYVNDVRV